MSELGLYLRERFEELVDPIDTDALVAELVDGERTVTPLSPMRPDRRKAWLAVAVAAVVTILAVGGSLFLLGSGGTGSEVIDTDTVPTVSSSTLIESTISPAGWDQWERFGIEVAELQSAWELDLGLDTDSDVWPQRLGEVCETDLTLDAFRHLGERFVAADIEAGLDLGEAESSDVFRRSSLVLLWGFALDVCVPEPLTGARNFIMPTWVNQTGLLESPEWPVRFEEVCALDPNVVEDYRPLQERYMAEDAAAGLSPAGADFVPPSGEETGMTLWIMAVSPEPNDVCPEHAPSDQRQIYDESTSLGGTWHLTQYESDGETAEPIVGSQVSLVVGRQVPFTGSLGCNNFIIRFDTDGAGGIEVATFWTTHKVCREPAGIMAQEEVLGSLLSRTVSFGRIDEGLEVITDTGDRLIWSR